MPRDLWQTASLFSDSARAAMVTALMDGTALPAGQLAQIANVSPQTASTHLTKLVDGNLLLVEQQGRHRYYRLANSDVAHAVESLLAITPRPDGPATAPRARPPVGTLAYARTCYSHLAGRLAVDIAEALQRNRFLQSAEPKAFAVTASGLSFLAELGIVFTESHANNSRFARRCLDWTERRHHIAGWLGAAMLTRFRELKWMAPVRGSRAVRVTLEGEKRLWELLRVTGRS